jgi:outer membrane protein
MNPRCALAFGLGALLVSGSVRAQQPETGLSVVHHPPPRPAPRRPARLRPAPAQPGTTTTPITAGGPRTLADALSVTYAYQPLLQSERAKLRATDENVPSALAGWRPTVITQGQLGYGDGISRAFNPLFSGWQKARTDRSLATAQATLTQPLYTGGKTQASVNQAKNKVMAVRANLMAQ